MKLSSRVWHIILMLLVSLPVFGDEPQADLSPDGIPFWKPDFTYSRRCILPSHSDLRDDRVVDWAFSTAIFRSVVLEQTKRLEEGGWIYQCRQQTADDKFEYYFDVLLVTSSYRGYTHIDLKDAEYYAHAPGNPECRTVGNFHTHPSHAAPVKSPTGDVQLLSGADVAGAERRGVPAFMIKNDTDPSQLNGKFPNSTTHEYGPWAGGWNEAGKDNLSWNCPVSVASATINIDSPDYGSINMELSAEKRGGKEGPRFVFSRWPGSPTMAFHIFDEKGEGVLDIFAPAQVGNWSGSQFHGDARIRVFPKGILFSHMGQVFPYQLEITEYEPGKRIAGSFSGEMRGHSKEMGDSRISGTFFLGPRDEEPAGIDFPDVSSDSPIG